MCCSRTPAPEAIEHATRMARIHTGHPEAARGGPLALAGATPPPSMHLTGDHRRWATDTGAAGAVHFFGPTAALPLRVRVPRRRTRSPSGRSTTSRT